MWGYSVSGMLSKFLLFSTFGSGSCFFGGSFCSSGSFGFCFGSGFSLGLGGSFGSFLSSNSFCFHFVLLYFLFETFLGSSVFSGRDFSLFSIGSRFLVFQPGLEALFCNFFGKGTFLYTAQQVLFQQYTFTREDVAHGVGGLSTRCQPIQSPFEIQIYCSRISVRIIRTYPFNKLTITWCPAIGDYNLIERIVFVTKAL